MSILRVVIVDDVPLARERVRRYLAGEADIEVVGEAASGADAVREIARLSPDLVFLDVELPDFDGFDIARRLPPQTRPAIIYITAHENRAIEAFDVNALDYLAKPFDRERFGQALNRARAFHTREKGGHRVAARHLTRLAVRERGRIDVLSVEDIDYIDVAGHYLCVHVGRQVHLIRGALSELEARLDPGTFARVHRSAIVRLDRVRSLSARRNGDSALVLADGARILMSRSYSEAVRAKLGIGED